MRFLTTRFVMTPQELLCAVEKYGFGICRSDIESGLRNEVLFSPRESKYDDLPLGGTKQGGEPDLSSGIDWPKYARCGVPGRRNTSKPMTFLMQVRCSDLKPFAPPQFPDHGLLSFFVAIEQNELVCDTHEQPLGRVLYRPGLAAEMQVRMPFPRGLYFGNRLPPCSLKIESSASIDFTTLCDVVERRLGYSQEIGNRVRNLYRQELISRGCHKSFGPATMVNTDLSDDSLLLLEFDLTELPSDILTDENGRLFFEINRDNLAACRFDTTSLRHDVIA